MTRRCPVCGAATGPSQRLCSTCNNGQLERYVAENPAGVTAYVTLGLAEMGAYLENWALFDLFLSERSIT